MVHDSDKINLIIADDSKLFVDGLLALIATNKKFNVVEVVDDGQKLISSKNIRAADIILVDINMPYLNGVEAAQQINFNNPHILLVAITMHKDKVYLQEIIQAGFKAFIYKPDVTHNLFEVLDKVLANKFVFPEILKTRHPGKA